MKISPFTPITFHEPGSRVPAEHGYVMSSADHILMEVFHDTGEKPWSLRLTDCDGNILASLGWNTVPINASVCMSMYELRDLIPGTYVVSFGPLVSQPLMVTDDVSVLDGTVLIQCAQRDNRSRRDMYSWVHGDCHYFDFRIPGGFRDDGWTFRVDNEQFVTPMSDIVELSAIDVTEKTLTVGHSCGVPVWMVDKINMMLSCDLLFIDGVRYSRVGSSVPEKVDSDVRGERFVFSQRLQEARFTNVAYENKIRCNLRRTPDALRGTGGALRKYMA